MNSNQYRVPFLCPSLLLLLPSRGSPKISTTKTSRHCKIGGYDHSGSPKAYKRGPIKALILLQARKSGFDFNFHSNFRFDADRTSLIDIVHIRFQCISTKSQPLLQPLDNVETPSQVKVGAYIHIEILAYRVSLLSVPLHVPRAQLIQSALCSTKMLTMLVPFWLMLTHCLNDVSGAMFCTPDRSEMIFHSILRTSSSR